MSADFSRPLPRGYVAGNRLALLESGAEYFPALIAAIDAALHEVHLETYIFADDPTGRRVAAALARAALRGVAVRVSVAEEAGAPAVVADETDAVGIFFAPRQIEADQEHGGDKRNLAG